MKTNGLSRAALIAVVCGPLWVGNSSYAKEVQGSEERPEAHHDESAALRDIPPNPPEGGPSHEMRRHPRRNVETGPDEGYSVVQSQAAGIAAAATGVGFEGLGNGSYGYSVTSAPPDTNGAVGPNHFVQWVNTAFAIFDKTGRLILGPANGNTIWSGFPGRCGASNDGDPIVQYDKLADRWVFMQPIFSSTPYGVCLAVSTTGDPTGSYNRYEFDFGSEFPDYPKLGVWPDGYYATFNLFNNGVIYDGPAFCAFDRAKMLTGAAATGQCFTPGAQFGGDLPSDLDGKTAPPAGSPNYILEFGTNALTLFKFHVDFGTPANSRLTGPISIPVAPFTAACNGGGTCIPQAGTSQQLDSLADRVMYRLAYRNFGSHESLVVNHAVAVNGTVGVRWYEIRSPGGTPSVFQQSTYAPDASSRWMGSIGMDAAGDIGLGYSISSSSTHPGIRITGQQVTDPLNTLQAETVVLDGAGSQTGGLSRWGDYSALTVDPADDCTFWYTNEYIPANGSFNWRTRIVSFKFPNCGSAAGPDFSLSATPSSQSVAQGNGASYTVTMTPSGGFSGSVTLSVTGLPTGASASFSTNPTTPSNPTSTMSVTSSSSTPTGTYALQIRGTSSTFSHTSQVTLVVTAAPSPDFSLSASPSSQSVVQGNGTSYTVTMTPSGGFNSSVTLSVTGLPTGASASFSTNPTTPSSPTSTMSVTTSSSTPQGTYALQVRGTSGTLSHTSQVTLVVNPASGGGDFSLSASPTSRTILQGDTTTYAISVNRTGGFAGGVTLSAGGLPSGATPAFSPNPATGTSSTLTVTTSGSTPRGTYSVVITGTSGSLRHTASVSLTVDFGDN